MVDNHSCVIVGVQATAARMSQETVAAQRRFLVALECFAGRPSLRYRKDKCTALREDPDVKTKQDTFYQEAPS
jgi:hypothetical protein